MITRTIEMHDINVVEMVYGKPELSIVTGYIGDTTKPNKVLKQLHDMGRSGVIAITGISEPYTKRYGMDETYFVAHAKCLDD